MGCRQQGYPNVNMSSILKLSPPPSDKPFLSESVEGWVAIKACLFCHTSVHLFWFIAIRFVLIHLCSVYETHLRELSYSTFVSSFLSTPFDL